MNESNGLDLSELITELEELSQENQQMQEQMRKLTLVNEKLNAENQSLNDKIVKLNEADKILKQNQQLEIANNRLSHQMTSMREEVAVAKVNLEKRAMQVQQQNDKVKATAGRLNKVIGERVKLETQGIKHSNEQKYKNKIKITEMKLYIPTVYAVILTIVELFKLPHIWKDAERFIDNILGFIVVPPRLIAHFFNNQILYTVVWLVILLIMGTLFMSIASLIIFLINNVEWQFNDSLAIICIFIVFLLFGTSIENVTHFNIVWLLFILLLVYTIFRSAQYPIFRDKKTEES